MNNHTTQNGDTTSDAGLVKRLRLVGFVEGTTLIVLVFVAVPLKYLAGWPTGTALMGPIHGASFLLYIVTLIEVSSSRLLNRAETIRTFAACMVPFGPFLNDGLMRQKLGRTKQD